MKDRAFVLRIVVVYSPVECERRTRMAKRYEELTISDDFMFGKVMEDKGLCRKVLECLLEKPVGRLEAVSYTHLTLPTTERV